MQLKAAPAEVLMDRLITHGLAYFISLTGESDRPRVHTFPDILTSCERPELGTVCII